jgi:hypothetical protein
MGKQAEATTRTDDARHDFDFFFGPWKQAHRKKVDLLVRGDTQWVEFESRTDARPILAGLGNVETFEAPEFPGRPGFEGFTLRLVEPDTGVWRIWWGSTIADGRLDPPVVGRFEDGVGIFEGDDVINGVPLKVRYTWKDVTPDSATWEQSFSFDGGETWDTNWITRHTRVIDETPAAETG